MKYSLFRRRSKHKGMFDKDWYQIPLRDKIALDRAIESELNDNNKLKCYVAILYNTELDDIPVAYLDNYVESLKFLLEPIPDVKVKDSYTINGTKYNFLKNINKMSAGQYLDYMNYIKATPIEYNKVLSTLMVPDGHKYCDGYDTDKVFEDMLDMKTPDVKAISNFLMRQSLYYIKNSANYSILKIWKTKGLTLKQKLRMINLVDRATTLTEHLTT